MRTSVTINDKLLQRARTLTGVSGATLVREGLRALIQRESARQLAKLGGTESKLAGPPRRKIAARV